MTSVQSQFYQQNGLPIVDAKSRSRSDKADDELECNAHVWLWRRGVGGPEILLQKRSQTKTFLPGWWLGSAGGGIDLGETPQVAAVRETKEEVGVDISVDDLYFVCVARGVYDGRDLMCVFTAEVPYDVNIHTQVSEVEQTVWLPLSEFEARTKDTDKYAIVRQPAGYFEAVIGSISTCIAV